MKPHLAALGLASFTWLACNRTESAPEHSHVHASQGFDVRLHQVMMIHGGTGPWAVAGYRMGEHALETLGLERGSFDLSVVHHTPDDVQYSCIADGAAAATGASLGKLNLELAKAEAPATRTTYENKATGESLTLRVTEGFKSRFSNVPRNQLSEAGREVMELADEEVFERIP